MKKNSIDVVIAVDDVHPEPGWGLPEDEAMNYLIELNREFGCKFTLFIPSNYHSKYPLSEYKDWVQWLRSLNFFELAAHGHYHNAIRPHKWGEMEFAEINDIDTCRERLAMIRHEWQAVDHTPVGWRHPGWVCSPINSLEIGTTFQYVALHYKHNRGLKWMCKEFYGHDGINETDIGVHDGRIMFQSHIAGIFNDNQWNERNYEQMRISLQHIIDNYDGVHFVTLEDCLE